MFDFESVDARDMPAYRELIGETNAALDKKGKIVSVTLPMEGEGWSPSQFAAVSDKIVLMAYDEHWQSGKSGPIASNDWFTRKMTKALQGMPADKVIVALGSYGYDWPKDKPADSLSVEEAWLAAHDSGANPSFDRGSGNTGFSYQEGDVRHDVWMLDAAASWNQMRILSHLGIGSVALWRLGTEDPGFWQALGTWRGETARLTSARSPRAAMPTWKARAKSCASPPRRPMASGRSAMTPRPALPTMSATASCPPLCGAAYRRREPQAAGADLRRRARPQMDPANPGHS
jgi:hypothetical protein